MGMQVVKLAAPKYLLGTRNFTGVIVDPFDNSRSKVVFCFLRREFMAKLPQLASNSWA